MPFPITSLIVWARLCNNVTGYLLVVVGYAEGEHQREELRNCS